MTLGQRFARFVTVIVVRMPGTWRLFRGRLTRAFDGLASQWDGLTASPSRLEVLTATLDALPAAPRRVLDLGTGTGSAARLAVSRWPDAQVTGVDVSSGMIEQARRSAAGGETYDIADASALPFPDGAFDLVTMNNMIPFFDELARVTAPGGHVAIAYSRGPQTPIWVPLERLRRELSRRDFSHFADFSAGEGRSLLARKADRS